ncbi:MAG: DUF6876 family protein [Leeuwenhoekiella sp.]|jgi:hypothetical protein|uniref:DUF6876 family protein n=1 Tax=Leeuwenhoekiella TaxID=283735 RepID=UPI000C689C30|nr:MULTISPECIES: DUF6876 family protein [Leeuwenhoekiella]MAO45447.1 hypothetical protein [Leeuwenhoekiella sp.]HBT11153.1 hypothetical protein [Leeuwenhoekiella sp.]HCW63372.1 hypothetical protein [Leeuwenhoekiella sp.]|tara:strand:- start:35 stop:415 length:381 start_codon:yes stop_codon:yes gene_type:complete
MSAQSKQLLEQLQGFCGSTTCFKIPLVKARYTEGVKYLAEQAQCHWLITDTAVVCKSLKNKSTFIVILFKRNSTSVQERTHKEAKIAYADGNGTILLEQEYEYTDFPLDELRLFFVDDMLMLPNEY